MDKNNKCGIYCIKNLVDNKIYVGQSVNINARWRQHRSHLRRNMHRNEHLQNAWNKYGEINFEFSILELCDIEVMDELERFYIERYDSMSRQNGYNCESGGNIKKKASDETRKKNI